MSKEEQVIVALGDLYHKMSWLNKPKMEDSLREFKSSEMHCIEAIRKNIDSNVTKLAESFYMTNGTISKLTKKLIRKGVIKSYQKPDNKKEIYFRLTEKGKAVYSIHEELHEEFQERDKIVFEQATEEQFDDMPRFVGRYSRHSDEEIKKLDVSMKPE